MPMICGTKATLLCASSAAPAGPAASRRRAAHVKSALISFNMDYILSTVGRRADRQSCSDLERPRVGMGARDQGNDLLGIGGLAPAFRDLAAAAEHRHPVGDLENFDQVVRDKHDRTAAVGETAREIEHLARLGHGECGGRLVHDDEARIEVECAADRYSLALAAGKATDSCIGVGDMGVQL